MDEQMIDVLVSRLAATEASIADFSSRLDCQNEKFLQLAEITNLLLRVVLEGSKQQQWGADWLHDEISSLQVKCRELIPAEQK